MSDETRSRFGLLDASTAANDALRALAQGSPNAALLHALQAHKRLGEALESLARLASPDHETRGD